jgi:exodeoxyribonuclease VII small subunit
MNTEETLTYQKAFEELQTIVNEIERGETNVDELAVKVERASILLRFCQEKITHTREQVDDILSKLEEDHGK